VDLSALSELRSLFSPKFIDKWSGVNQEYRAIYMRLYAPKNFGRSANAKITAQNNYTTILVHEYFSKAIFALGTQVLLLRMTLINKK
jgi:hypothetical protein